jgi:hypothetical protein
MNITNSLMGNSISGTAPVRDRHVPSGRSPQRERAPECEEPDHKGMDLFHSAGKDRPLDSTLQLFQALDHLAF